MLYHRIGQGECAICHPAVTWIMSLPLFWSLECGRLLDIFTPQSMGHMKPAVAGDAVWHIRNTLNLTQGL